MRQIAKESKSIFGSAQLKHFRHNFSLQRRSIADKLRNSRLKQISLKTFRQWKATMEYHRNKDILHVMNVLGHENIKNTLVYTHPAEEPFKGEQEYLSKVAKNEKDICALVDAGFEYVCDYEGHKVSRKRKY
jgi:hypothetical protein